MNIKYLEKERLGRSRILYKEIKKYLRSKGVKRKYLRYVNLGGFGKGNHDEHFQIIFDSNLFLYGDVNMAIDFILMDMVSSLISYDLCHELSCNRWVDILTKDWFKYNKVVKAKLK